MNKKLLMEFRIKNYIENKTIIIIGATSGLGESLTKIFSNYKTNLIIVGKDQSKLDNLIEICSKKNLQSIIGYKVDLSSLNEVNQFCESIDKKHSEISIYFYCAANNVAGKIYDIPSKEVEKITNINLTSLILTSKTIIKIMNKNSTGHLNFIGSGASEFGIPNESLYSLTKSALDRYIESLSQELGKFITITKIYPNRMNSKLLKPKCYGDFSINHTNDKYENSDNVAYKIIKNLPLKKNNLYLSYNSIIMKFMALFPSILKFLLKKI